MGGLKEVFLRQQINPLERSQRGASRGKDVKRCLRDGRADRVGLRCVLAQKPKVVTRDPWAMQGGLEHGCTAWCQHEGGHSTGCERGPGHCMGWGGRPRSAGYPHGSRERTSSKVHRAASWTERGTPKGGPPAVWAGGKWTKGTRQMGESERRSSCSSLLAGVPASAQKR